MKCSKCICTSCLKQPNCERSCGLCKKMEGYVMYCAEEDRAKQLTIFKEDNNNGN